MAEDAFEKLDGGVVLARPGPFLGDPLAQLMKVEGAFVRFFATGDLAPFCEGPMYAWVFSKLVRSSTAIPGGWCCSWCWRWCW